MLTFGRDLIMITLLLIMTEHASSHNESKPNNSSIQRYCGNNLVNVLVMVCDGIYNQMAIKEGLEAMARAEALRKSGSTMPREKRSVADIFQGRTHLRQRRGAYEECCRIGCTIEEMTRYCGAND